MEVLSWIWDGAKEGGTFVSLVLIVILFFMDKLWVQRFTELRTDLNGIRENTEDMDDRIGIHSSRLEGLERDRDYIKERVERIHDTLTRHDNDERGFWNEVRQFMLFQGYRGGGEDKKG